jgi:acyl-homoserine lactone acylase PvdQ
MRDVEAYTAGINAYLAENHVLPPEYHVLQHTTVERWHSNDTFLFLKVCFVTSLFF